MDQIAAVAFSLALLLSVQAVVGRDIQTQEFNLSGSKPAVADTNTVKELGSSLAELDLTPKQVNWLNEEFRDAMKSGELDDMAKVPLSPEQEDNVLHTALIGTFMKMADDGVIDPEVAKEKLYPKEKAVHPEIESAFNQIIQKAKISQEKKADAVKE